jgi:hypothetical protein
VSYEIYPLFNDNEWKDVPKGLYIETALYREQKRKLPEGALPLEAKRTEMNTFTPLYALEQAEPNYKGQKAKTKAKVTPKTEEDKAQEKKLQEAKKHSPFGWIEEMRKGDNSSKS